MDKEKYIMAKDKEKAKEVEKLLDEGFDFEDVVGQHMTISITGIINENGLWTIEAEGKYAMSLDGVDWVGSEVPVSTADESYEAALASSMMAIAGALNDENVLARIRYGLNQRIKGLEGSKEVM
jgi:hypothetical protein